MRRFAARRALLGAATLVTSLAATLLLGTPSARATHFVPAPIGSDDFVTSRHYSGDFPDPSVLRVGATYYAYSTTIANKNLPVLRSTNLRTWTAVATRNDGDALAKVPAWTDHRWIGKRRVAPTWAPSVVHVGGRYLHAYATRLRDGSRFCISISRSSSPTGPFVDSSRGPLVCPAHEGVIDPYLWSNDGALYLIYKTEGIPGREPTRLIIGRLWSDASRFAPSQPRRELLRTAPGTWEGSVVENPAMIRYRGRYYLFYSANNWASSSYAVGYATCTGPTGPCTRASSRPLVASRGSFVGPGGQSPFVDTGGSLRLAYHAWTKGRVGYPASSYCLRSDTCPQRRLRVARLVPASDGTLSVSSYSQP